MSKQWFFQVMGEELGPVSSVELKEKVKQGQIQPETLVRLSREGKWTPADRVKGLLDPRPAPAVIPPTPAVLPVSKTQDSAPVPLAASKAAALHVERTYHLQGAAESLDAETDAGSEPTEYDFFQFVGFELAIGVPLHQKLLQHCRSKHQTMTEVTRLALADYLGCPELVRAPLPVGTPPNEAHPEQNAESSG